MKEFDKIYQLRDGRKFKLYVYDGDDEEFRPYYNYQNCCITAECKDKYGVEEIIRFNTSLDAEDYEIIGDYNQSCLRDILCNVEVGCLDSEGVLYRFNHIYRPIEDALKDMLGSLKNNS